MTNTITFHLKRDLVVLSSLQNTYHNWLNLGPNRDQQTKQFFELTGLETKKWKDDQWNLSFGPEPDSGNLSFGPEP